MALMRAFRRSPIDFLDVLVASGAGTAPLRIGPERVLLVDDATQVWELLTTHARRTGKGRGLVRARMLLGEGLLTSEGDQHLRHRRALQPAFHPQRIAEYQTHFAGAAQRAAARWSDGGEIDLVAEMSAMTLDGAGAALFGSDLREPAPQITRALTNLLAGLPARHGSRRSEAAPLSTACRHSRALSQGRARERRRRPHPRALGWRACVRAGPGPAGGPAGADRRTGPGPGDDACCWPGTRRPPWPSPGPSPR